MKRSGPVRVVLTGGGTGGHVYPALALHEALVEAGIAGESLYLGIRGRAEEVIVPRHGLRLGFVRAAPVAGSGLLGKLRAGVTIAGGVLQAIGHLLRFRPKLVVATGGYASAPVVFAAFLLRPWLGLRIVLDEQNLAPGLLNKAASLLADLVLVAFRETPYFVWSTRCLFTGYPVRAAYREVGEEEPAALRRRLGVPEEATLVVVSGGSLGSRSINRALAAALPALAEVPGLFIVHGLGLARGPEYDAVADSLPRLAAALGERFDAASRTARNAAGELFYRATEYFHDFADWQRAADLVVGRAGAGALAETMALGRAMIAVPKRGLPGDHQELNAVALAEEGAVEVLFERAGLGGEVDQVPAEELAAAIVALANDPERRARLAARARALDTPESARLATEAIGLLLAGREPATTSAIVEPAFVRFQRQYDSLVAHLEATPRGLYHRLYDAKVDEYLAAGDEATVNRGIKLVGALRRADRYPELIAGLARWPGFLRRNALAALAKAERCGEGFAAAAERGLGDSYWEVRREALALILRFPAELGAVPALGRGVERLAGRRREGFEVRGAALRAAVAVLDERRFLALAAPFATERSVRLREALLDAVARGLESGRLRDRMAVRLLLERVVVTTSEFSPSFRIRERFLAAARALEEEPR
ncbi:MAG: UDP-N-acetylglucosamine--N-acetylmuramyl-(pentapeptide) pyrophosphoryl-undecaprenol N-acetylglucosamine transferase [Acidobacteria bacterium ADurb.Bin051]|jgi:UDP-N-acetylglucosamine--N-acetylmuramyl-(pentapeptide) pyrophosphoryl-undecaprenol N-acetylglucosamine transferase|nr:MAG: UDP-N-acetylglucosamine--N-acetylmuramyl-(pentapeptide) pyrophosphoryl-undecaprenol N-acetylglucosamine transferase [Acidobacteria bacterium ADurb.Bin051]